MIVARLVNNEDITEVIAAAITGAPVTITCAKATKPSANAVATVGINVTIPVMIVVNASTTAFDPLAVIPASIPKPTANACMPRPAKNRPAPKAATPIPKINIAAPSSNIAGITGVNNAAAPPNINNAPPSAKRAIHTPSKLRPDKSINDGVNTAMATAANNNAADPDTVPVIKCKANAKTPKDSANANKPILV